MQRGRPTAWRCAMATSINSKRRQALARWTALLQRHLPTLSLPEAKGLALWSLGIVLARSSSLHAVVLALACWLPLNPLSLRKPPQGGYGGGAPKKGPGPGGRGPPRRDGGPPPGAADLLAWILDDWPSRQVVLALGPTNFGDRF